MKQYNFAKYLTSFFEEYLSNERGVSHNTIRSYSNTFVLFLQFLEEEKRTQAEHIKIELLTKDLVVDFLNWLQYKNSSSNSTRNQRLAAIHSFCRYMQYEDIIHLAQWQSILSIKSKRAIKTTVNYICIDGIKLILEQIPTVSKEGRRNLAMLLTLYSSGARVQELIDLTPSDVHLIKPYYITLFGKGQKRRLVPLQEHVISLLKEYMCENRLDSLSSNKKPLFANKRGAKFSAAGITYILSQYVDQARVINPDIIPIKVSPHSFRHSKAMHLLQAGVNLVYIRDILGHVSIQTTEIYARSDSKQKKEALEAAYINIIPATNDVPSWEKDSKLKLWLKGLH